MKLFLDTNILIDHFLRRDPFFKQCEQLLICHAFGDCSLWASAKSFTDIFYVGKNAANYRELQEAFSQSLEYLHVCSVGADEIREAANLGWNDFEDALVETCARKVGADFLLTRDLDGFKDARIPVMTPEAFFAWLEKEHDLTYETVDL